VHYWSYANTIETAVLLVIIYDIVWHRWNAIREIKRDQEAEASRIQREEASEKRQVRREREQFVRKHWQELQANLILLHRSTSELVSQKKFILENNASQDPTIRHALVLLANGLPQALAEFHDRWGRVVAQLNVFPEPRDLLALEILAAVQGLDETVKGNDVEVKDETLLALANLARRAAEPGRLPNVDD
jgi:hypothetical protein